MLRQAVLTIAIFLTLGFMLALLENLARDLWRRLRYRRAYDPAREEIERWARENPELARALKQACRASERKNKTGIRR
jgi:hypothetical protein